MSRIRWQYPGGIRASLITVCDISKMCHTLGFLTNWSPVNMGICQWIISTTQKGKVEKIKNTLILSVNQWTALSPQVIRAVNKRSWKKYVESEHESDLVLKLRTVALGSREPRNWRRTRISWESRKNSINIIRDISRPYRRELYCTRNPQVTVTSLRLKDAIRICCAF